MEIPLVVLKSQVCVKPVLVALPGIVKVWMFVLGFVYQYYLFKEDIASLGLHPVSMISLVSASCALFVSVLLFYRVDISFFTCSFDTLTKSLVSFTFKHLRKVIYLFMPCIANRLISVPTLDAYSGLLSKFALR